MFTSEYALPGLAGIEREINWLRQMAGRLPEADDDAVNHLHDKADAAIAALTAARAQTLSDAAVKAREIQRHMDGDGTIPSDSICHGLIESLIADILRLASETN